MTPPAASGLYAFCLPGHGTARSRPGPRVDRSLDSEEESLLLATVMRGHVMEQAACELTVGCEETQVEVRGTGIGEAQT